MKPITCTGKDNVEREFYYDVKYDDLDNEYLIRVFDVPNPLDGHAFEIKYKPLSEGIWRQADLFHHNVEKYRSKGIADAMIPEISKQYKVIVESSPTQGTSGEFEEDIRRSPDATKVWERLRAKGFAIYRQETDVYFCQAFSE